MDKVGQTTKQPYKTEKTQIMFISRSTLLSWRLQSQIHVKYGDAVILSKKKPSKMREENININSFPPEYHTSDY